MAKKKKVSIILVLMLFLFSVFKVAEGLTSESILQITNLEILNKSDTVELINLDLQKMRYIQKLFITKSEIPLHIKYLSKIQKIKITPLNQSKIIIKMNLFLTNTKITKGSN